MEVEDEIQLAHISEVLVQYLNEGLHQFQHDQLVLVLINDSDEVKTGESLVDDLVLLVLNEIAHLRITGYDKLVHLALWHCFTSFRMRCFSNCERLEEYHLVNLDRPWRLIRKKQWIMGYYYREGKNHIFLLLMVELLREEMGGVLVRDCSRCPKIYFVYLSRLWPFSLLEDFVRRTFSVFFAGFAFS